jgi:hypothetical protein
MSKRSIGELVKSEDDFLMDGVMTPTVNQITYKLRETLSLPDLISDVTAAEQICLAHERTHGNLIAKILINENLPNHSEPHATKLLLSSLLKNSDFLRPILLSVFLQSFPFRVRPYQMIETYFDSLVFIGSLSGCLELVMNVIFHYMVELDGEANLGHAKNFMEISPEFYTGPSMKAEAMTEKLLTMILKILAIFDESDPEIVASILLKGYEQVLLKVHNPQILPVLFFLGVERVSMKSEICFREKFIQSNLKLIYSKTTDLVIKKSAIGCLVSYLMRVKYLDSTVLTQTCKYLTEAVYSQSQMEIKLLLVSGIFLLISNCGKRFLKFQWIHNQFTEIVLGLPEQDIARIDSRLIGNVIQRTGQKLLGQPLRDLCLRQANKEETQEIVKLHLMFDCLPFIGIADDSYEIYEGIIETSEPTRMPMSSPTLDPDIMDLTGNYYTSESSPCFIPCDDDLMFFDLHEDDIYMKMDFSLEGNNRVLDRYLLSQAFKPS